MTASGPLCTICHMPMMERTNRLTKEPLWGCRRFPVCKTTLPYLYDGRATKQAPEEIQANAKQEMISKGKEKSFTQRDRPKPRQAKEDQGGALASSDGSWVRDRTDQDRQRHGVVPRREGRAQDQHQLDTGRGRADSANARSEESSGHQDRQGFGIPQQGAGAVMACETCDVSESECNLAKQPLGRAEIRKGALEGNTRRAHLKRCCQEAAWECSGDDRWSVHCIDCVGRRSSGSNAFCFPDTPGHSGVVKMAIICHTVLLSMGLAQA